MVTRKKSIKNAVKKKLVGGKYIRVTGTDKKGYLVEPKKAVRKKQAKTQVLRVLGQTGKRKSIALDRKLKATPPSKRKSATGNIYWETRKNRTDKKGSKI